MRILIDGDACPSKDLIKSIAKKNNVETHIFFDTAHSYADDYFKVHIVSKAPDAVDLAIINFLHNEDIVITGDYGLASITLKKAKHVVNPSGFLYTESNMDELLFRRYLGSKSRRIGKYPNKIKKRSNHNDQLLENLLISILKGWDKSILLVPPFIMFITISDYLLFQC